MTRSYLLYPLVLIVFTLGIYAVILKGQTLRAPDSPASPAHVLALTRGAEAAVEPSVSLFASLRENLQDPLSRLFIQLILIVLGARLCGAVARHLGQPAVIGEMLAGIILGPSLLGWVWPALFHFVFPVSSLGTLRLLSQVGVCLFMFVIGMDLDLGHLKHQARTALFVSQVSILLPYGLGVALALFLFTTLAAPNTTFMPFALFIGISMSITAFPVLARILDERAADANRAGQRYGRLDDFARRSSWLPPSASSGSTYKSVVLGLPPNDFGVQGMSQRHGGRWNVGFCDGHVENLRPNDLFNLSNSVVAQRWNIDHLAHNGPWVPPP